jgi:allantoicase
MTDLEFTDLPDLACEAVGGAVLEANDEFFAPKENLVRERPPEWREHEYTDRGKWMDGWETRRRREPGHDWCLVRLGLPGRVRGVVVDTRWFRGNFPESCAVDVCEISGPLDRDALAGAAWTEIVPRSPLRGDAHNRFPVAAAPRATHVRLRIFPDGGVARLRVHGEVLPDWERLLALGGPIDLAALENGAQVTAASDMFFGSRENLIRPGRAAGMFDGWETRRRRGPGHDWAIVRLAASGTIRRAEIDTSHFKGNAPGRCTLEASSSDPPDKGWRPLADTRLQPHTRHELTGELRALGPVRWARLSVFPDGGVARLRLWGEVAAPPPSGLVRLNGWQPEAAVAALRACCGSRRFAERLAAARPFEDLPALVRAADRIWWSLEESDWLEAFAAHPMIGERAPHAGGGRWSEAEQAGVRDAGAPVPADLAALNRAYADKFGFIYLVCASGRSAGELLDLLRARLEGSRADELTTAAEEQAKIAHLRLRKLVTEGPA